MNCSTGDASRAPVAHVLLRLIVCRMGLGLLVIEHRTEIAHLCACGGKR
jgi:hypothetical protein